MLRKGKYLFTITIFFTLIISLIMRLTCLKIAVHILRIHLEGSVFQNVDIGLSLNLVAFRRGAFKTLQ